MHLRPRTVVEAESEWCARIVGVLSAGKSRLLAEILRNDVPDALLPVCSPEAQTILPLEVTYGPDVRLSLMEGSDGTTEERLVLDRFPTRRQLEALPFQIDQCRLRLEVPLRSLLLEEDPDYDGDGPVRIKVLDTRGWDEVGGDADEDEIKTHDNDFATILVCPYRDLEKRYVNELFRRALVGGIADTLCSSPKLLVYVTNCPPRDHSEAKQRVDQILDDVMGRNEDVRDRLSEDGPWREAVTIEALDLNQLQDPQREALQRRFWDSVFPNWDAWKALEPRVDWEEEARKWGAQEALEALFREARKSRSFLAAIKDEKGVATGLKKPRRNHSDAQQRCKRIREEWDRKIRTRMTSHYRKTWRMKPTDDSEDAYHPLVNWREEWPTALDMDPHSPCASWWYAHIVPLGEEAVHETQKLADACWQAVGAVRGIPDDVDALLLQKIAPQYRRAEIAHERLGVVLRSRFLDPEFTDLTGALATLMAMTVVSSAMGSSR